MIHEHLWGLDVEYGCGRSPPGLVYEGKDIHIKGHEDPTGNILILWHKRK